MIKLTVKVSDTYILPPWRVDTLPNRKLNPDNGEHM